jgi:redox-sensing transcriptional repressor
VNALNKVRPLAEQVSELTTARLSIYLRCLNELDAAGVKTVSSLALAEQFHLNAAQIRKDLAYFGEFGIRGVGYEVGHLIDRLRHLLGLDRQHGLVIVGVGSLGTALARFPGFNCDGYKVVGLVDSDPRKAGRRLGILLVEPLSRLPDLVAETAASIGVLAVPSPAAQETYDALVAAGVGAVLNFAARQIRAVPAVPVKSVDLRIGLEELGYFLTHGG